MLNIIAIGGGSMIEGQTASIDREVVVQSGKKNPKALFIPTASGDNPVNCANFQKVYGARLGCHTDSLLLLQHPPHRKEIKNKIEAADIIYVGGGNTLMMMRRWRFLGVDKLLMKACVAGKVVAGSSAGAICWFNYGHSDSMSFYHPENWDWIRVKCLGILPFTACPHYLTEGRAEHFRQMIKSKGGTGIALDDCSAFHVHGEKFRILQSKKGAKAYRVVKKKNEVIQELLPVTEKFQALSHLSVAVS